MTHLLYIPDWTPASDNELKNRWKRKKLKERDAHMVGSYRLLENIPRALDRRRVSAIFCYGPGHRRRDRANLFKSLFDALVTTGLLMNDSEVWLEHGDFRCVKGEETFSVIWLEDL